MGREGTVLVTGGAGYIGSHAVLALKARGRRVVTFDNLSTGTEQLAALADDFVRGDVTDAAAVDEVLDRHGITAVMHFAGSIVVPESVADPAKYYANNTGGTLTVARACVARGVGPFVFSSSAAVYGEPDRTPLPEDAPTRPINPYGWSKLMSEQMLADLAVANSAFRPLSLRYFNVSGADPQGRAGQSGPESTHLIRIAVEVATGKRERLDIYGADYPTRDGTCERDYIHVSDLADAHVAALDYLEAGGAPAVLNCGYGQGFTVREVIAALDEILGRPLPRADAPRRPGDPAASVSDPTRLLSTLDWRPARQDLKGILASALAWQEKLGR